MDLKIIPPRTSTDFEPKVESFDPGETMGALQQAVVRSFFGDEGDGEVTGCVVGAFGIVSDDPSKTPRGGKKGVIRKMSSK